MSLPAEITVVISQKRKQALCTVQGHVAREGLTSDSIQGMSFVSSLLGSTVFVSIMYVFPCGCTHMCTGACIHMVVTGQAWVLSLRSCV